MAVGSQDMESEILAVNDAFYSAFTTRDIDAMEKLWATSATVTCVHPGWNAARGREPVMISWQTILSSPESPRIASANVTSCFPGQSTTRTPAYFAGSAAYNSATTVYSPNRHGSARRTVLRHQPRVVSRPR